VGRSACSSLGAATVRLPLSGRADMQGLLSSNPLSLLSDQWNDDWATLNQPPSTVITPAGL
jgi:hypothetical protein